MCCFTADVSVSNTSIFVRDAGIGRQFVVYSMDVSTTKEVAMVLPLPIAAWANGNVKGLTFIDLSGYPEFFADLAKMFIDPSVTAAAAAPAPGDAPLPVQQIGAFEASYVPTAADFARLDPRFQLPAAFWDKLPRYRDYGFAVFKLRPGHLAHPMALSFQRAEPATLFFPTVHVHDGAIHDKAHFHHTLYVQLGPFHAQDFAAWRESDGHPKGSSIDVKRTVGMLAEDQHVFRTFLKGNLANQDTVLQLA